MTADDKNTTVTFRLPAELHDVLVRQAIDAGTSKHLLARMLVMRTLTDPDIAETGVHHVDIADSNAQINANIIGLRYALGRGVAAILEQVAPQMNKEKVRKWVFERIITLDDSRDSEM